MIEVLIRSELKNKLRLAINSINLIAIDLKNASTDDEKQQALLKLGIRLLFLSLAGLIVILMLLFGLALPIWCLNWPHEQNLNYVTLVAVFSLVWFFFRSCLVQK